MKNKYKFFIYWTVFSLLSIAIFSTLAYYNFVEVFKENFEQRTNQTILIIDSFLDRYYNLSEERFDELYERCMMGEESCSVTYYSEEELIASLMIESNYEFVCSNDMNSIFIDDEKESRIILLKKDENFYQAKFYHLGDRIAKLITPFSDDNLLETVREIKLGEQGYIYFLSNGGTLILHPNSEGLNFANLDFVQEMLLTKNGVIKYIDPTDENFGKKKLVSYHYNEHYRFIIAGGFYYNEITASFRFIQILLISYIVAITIINIIISYYAGILFFLKPVIKKIKSVSEEHQIKGYEEIINEVEVKKEAKDISNLLK